jgi:hypothetical protein
MKIVAVLKNGSRMEVTFKPEVEPDSVKEGIELASLALEGPPNLDHWEVDNDFFALRRGQK